MGFRNQVFFLKNLSKQIKKLTCSQQKPKKESIACNKEKIVKSLPTRLFLYFWLKLHSLFSRKNQSCIVEDVTNIYSRYGCVSWFSGYITLCLAFLLVAIRTNLSTLACYKAPFFTKNKFDPEKRHLKRSQATLLFYQIEP